MKKTLYKYMVACSAAALLVSSCSLDETNPNGNTGEIVYTTPAGFEGLINSLYTDFPRVMYGRLDMVPITEAGTDLWITPDGQNQPGFYLYNDQFTTSLSTIYPIWNSLYTIANWANTAIYYADYEGGVKDIYTTDQLNAKVAEAHFMRGWAYFMIVELWGDVVLRTEPTFEAEYTAHRTPEEDFYEVILSDLEFAAKYLPISHGDERGRVARKAALGFLSKAYLQRTRLGDVEKYAKLALDTAKELIDNQTSYGCQLYQRDANSTGFNKMFDGENNKSNTESLFTMATADVSNLIPGGAAGRTGKYYMLNTGDSQYTTLGGVSTSYRYLRGNELYSKPSMHLLTSIFDPREDTPDCRFEDSFFTVFRAGQDGEVTQAIADNQGKDPSLVGHKTFGEYAVIQNAVNSNLWTESDNSDTVAYMVNWKLDEDWKKFRPYLINDPWDLYTDDKIAIDNQNRKFFYPALKKFTPLKYIYANNVVMMDFHIMRLAEVYLIAAEAALLYNNDQATAASYVNVIRERATKIGHDVSEMTAPVNAMTVRYVIDERARELCGEHMRWIDLKRAGLLSKEFFQETNPALANNFNPSIHLKRPIPQTFLDAISNPDEFGTNGYY